MAINDGKSLPRILIHPFFYKTFSWHQASRNGWMSEKRISHYIQRERNMGIGDSRIKPLFENEMLITVDHDEILV
jgi:hypothetical protein